MSLSTTRTLAYLFGALTGGFAAVAIIASRRRRAGASLLALGLSLSCGAAAVALEEATQRRRPHDAA